MRVPFVDLKAQYASIKSEIDEAMQCVVHDCAFIKGKYVEQFEEEFAAYLGAKFCIGCGNGTDALEIAISSLGIGQGDEVIVPANTFIATSEAVTANGATPVFCDIHPQTYNLDVDLLASKITPRTKAIIAVHLYGQPADMDPIVALAKQHGIKVIEDSAQAHGAEYKGQKIGTLGDIATFSFFPGKNLGAYGDGGALITKDEELATKSRMIANHGRVDKYDHIFEGRNSRLDGLQAAILSVKLRHLDSWSQARREAAKAYSESLSGSAIIAPHVPQWATPVFHLYVVRIENRQWVQEELNKKGVSSGVHYPIALPFLRAYQRFGHTPKDFPIAHEQMDTILSLPMFPEITSEQIAYVVDSLRAIT
ncbi:MAG: DegT/DnrJ/EryC1/StrS family aminotransferase [Bdellovibrionales bacterium]|nr:DegT/DnrJ/EryC1/StrS family aminotransferase [Bdellovibrionales bacterium]